MGQSQGPGLEKWPWSPRVEGLRCPHTHAHGHSHWSCTGERPLPQPWEAHTHTHNQHHLPGYHLHHFLSLSLPNELQNSSSSAFPPWHHSPLCRPAPTPAHTQPAAPSPGPHYSEVTQRGSCEVLAITLRHRQASRLPRAECGHPQLPSAPRVKPRTA